MLPMDITALVPWFGSKRNLAPSIACELGTHRIYWEPFCASMAVLLVKPPCRMETVNDLHGDLINLARVIQHPIEGARFYRRLRRTLFHEDLHAEARHTVCSSPGPADGASDPERAYQYFLMCWMGRNGEAGLSPRERSSRACVRWTANGGSASTRFDSAVRSIPAWRRRLARVMILRRDAFELLERIDDASGTAIYCDPPYVEKTDRYVHDFAADDHTRLRDALSRFRRARVVVSYYAHPLIDQLYEGWTVRRIDVTKTLSLQGSQPKRGSRATEVLLINGPSLAGKSLF